MWRGVRVHDRVVVCVCVRCTAARSCLLCARSTRVLVRVCVEDVCARVWEYVSVFGSVGVCGVFVRVCVGRGK